MRDKSTSSIKMYFQWLTRQFDSVSTVSPLLAQCLVGVGSGIIPLFLCFVIVDAISNLTGVTPPTWAWGVAYLTALFWGIAGYRYAGLQSAD